MLKQGGLELGASVGGDDGGNAEAGDPAGYATASAVILGMGMASDQRVNLSITVNR